jgi:hypothetical protein
MAKKFLELNLIELSENLLPQIKNNPELEIIGPAHEMEFDDQGNLVNPFPQVQEH